MDAVTRIGEIIGPSIEAMGYGLVRVQLTGGQRPTLQIMAERTDLSAMTVEDCADISHAVSALLDVDDPLPTAYVLEVSSPGIDRPLTRLSDYSRFQGLEARLETALPIEGRKRFRGILMGVEDDHIRMTLVEKPSKKKTESAASPPAQVDVRIPFNVVLKGKLELTDDLLQQAAAEQAEAGTEGGTMEVSDDARPAKRPYVPKPKAPKKKGPGRFAKADESET